MKVNLEGRLVNDLKEPKECWEKYDLPEILKTCGQKAHYSELRR
jgi:hypothetical protein